MNNGGQARGSVGGMKLYSGPLSMFGAKAEIAALEKVLEFELVMVPFEMALVFNGLEVVALLLAVLIANHITQEGESSWFEGLQLVAVYLVMAITFAFV